MLNEATRTRHKYGAQETEPRPEDPLISLVVPVKNEAETVDDFCATVEKVLRDIGARYEIIFVNDGSDDDTLDVLLGHVERSAAIRVVDLSRGFGKEAALTAGLDHIRGDVAIPIDVDLQDPPELIGDFIAHWRIGYDVVYGVRSSRSGDSTLKRTSANQFYRLFNRLSAIRIPENTGDFRLIDRRVVEALKLFPERNRFMKGLFAWVGFRSIGVPYDRHPRSAGTSKWTYWRLWNFALDGVTGFSTLPLRIWAYVGGVLSVIAFGYGGFLLIRTMSSGTDVPGYASMMVTLLFVAGVQLMSLGLIGEYLGRLFEEAKRRPIYIVREEYGRED